MFFVKRNCTSPLYEYPTQQVAVLSLCQYVVHMISTYTITYEPAMFSLLMYFFRFLYPSNACQDRLFDVCLSGYNICRSFYFFSQFVCLTIPLTATPLLTFVGSNSTSFTTLHFFNLTVNHRLPTSTSTSTSTSI